MSATQADCLYGLPEGNAQEYNAVYLAWLADHDVEQSRHVKGNSDALW